MSPTNPRRRPVAIEKKERQALLDMLWERAVLTVHGADNQGEPIDADEAWRELKASLAAAGFELDLTVIEGKEAPAV